MNENNKNIVEIKNVSKVFHKQNVLKNVCLMIRKKCVYGLLDPNGAGKSTLLKKFNRYYKADKRRNHIPIIIQG